MKKATSLLIILVAALALSACNVNLQIGNNEVITGSGNVVTREIEVSDFDAVRLAGVGELSITQGETESLTIEAEDNILDVLESNVRASELVLGTRQGVTITPTRPIRYTLTVKDLSALELSGLGNASMDGLTTGRLELSISGSGNLELKNVQAEDVRATIDGLGSVEISGTAKSLDARLNGSGNFKAGDLAVKTANVRIDGLGSATVWAADTLDVNIGGAGSLDYYGSPSVTQKISGLGHVDNRGAK